MKKTFLPAIAIFLLLAHLAVGQSTSKAIEPDTLRARALLVGELEMRRQLGGATPATVDSLLALYSDTVVYEHPNAGAIIRGKPDLRRGMLGYLGSVRGAVADPPHVVVGPGVVVVETTVRMEVRNGSAWTPVTRHGVRVIEFDGVGKVRRLIDYPW
jgi:hypothetical protein